MVSPEILRRHLNRLEDLDVDRDIVYEVLQDRLDDIERLRSVFAPSL